MSQVIQQTSPHPRKTNPEKTHRKPQTPSTPSGLKTQRIDGLLPLPIPSDLAEIDFCLCPCRGVDNSPIWTEDTPTHPSLSSESSWASSGHLHLRLPPTAVLMLATMLSLVSDLKNSGMFTVTCQEKYRVGRAGGVPRHSSATCGSSGAPQVALGGLLIPDQLPC